MIEFENVTKWWPTREGRHYIVRGLDLVLPRGKSLGLIGRNGAGKSTMMSMIAGTLDPDEGWIHRHARISWPLGFAGSFHPNLTGAQNVRFVARSYGVDTQALLAFVEEFAELGDFMHEPVQTYSSGMRSRLAFGVSMGVEFDYYLIDEVTAVGDASFRAKSKAVLEDRLRNSDVIMVSHSMSAIRTFCTCGLVIEKGTATYFDDIEDAIEQHMRNMHGNVEA